MEFEISVLFELRGSELEPEKITALLGIIPTKSWRVNDLVHPKAGVRRKSNGWSLKSQLDKSAELDEHIKSIFEELQPSWQSLVEICKQYDALISCAVYRYQQIPAIDLDKDIVKKAAELNAGIDVDVYYLPKD
jgi:hypothetical protein